MSVLLGSWNPSVVLTYLGGAIATVGIGLAAGGSVRGAVACLVLAGLADLADGPVARSVRRDAAAKRFGVQLDTVTDVISFVALPVAIFHALLSFPAAVAAGAVWLVAALARLAHFSADQADAEAAVAHYRGVPVTYGALVIPIVYLVGVAAPAALSPLLVITAVTMAALFVLDVRVPKPRGLAYLGFGALAVVVLVLLGVLAP